MDLCSAWLFIALLRWAFYGGFPSNNRAPKSLETRIRARRCFAFRSRVEITRRWILWSFAVWKQTSSFSLPLQMAHINKADSHTSASNLFISPQTEQTHRRSHPDYWPRPLGLLAGRPSAEEGWVESKSRAGGNVQEVADQVLIYWGVVVSCLGTSPKWVSCYGLHRNVRRIRL